MEDDFQLIYYTDLNEMNYLDYQDDILRSMYKIMILSNLSNNKLVHLTGMTASTIYKIFAYVETSAKLSFHYKTINKANNFILKVVNLGYLGDYDVH